jgi:SWI/SNF-related matrix-associated actin-dependent regulator of chromatin subfamily A3
MLPSIPVSKPTLHLLGNCSRAIAVSVRGSTILTTGSDPQQVGSLDNWTSDVLSKLVNQNGIELQCRLNTQDFTMSRTRRDGLAKPSKIAITVIVYGPMDLLDAVGDFLVQCELFLQDPVGCDRNVRYRNPQSLWGTDDSEIRMAQVETPTINCNFDVFRNASDLLEGFEYEEELSEAEQPLSLQTVLHR